MMLKTMEKGMLYIIDGETYHPFTKNTWIGDLGFTCHVANNDTGLNDFIDINESTDKKNGYTFWQDAMQKELKNVKITFQTIPEGKKLGFSMWSARWWLN